MVIGLCLLTLGMVVNIRMTMELRNRVNALATHPILASNMTFEAMLDFCALAQRVSCPETPIRLVVDDPICAKQVSESLNAFDVQVSPSSGYAPGIAYPVEVGQNRTQRPGQSNPPQANKSR
jgi:hypothetical protein